jgi:hypothetical protein
MRGDALSAGLGTLKTRYSIIDSKLLELGWIAISSNFLNLVMACGLLDEQKGRFG